MIAFATRSVRLVEDPTRRFGTVYTLPVTTGQSTDSTWLRWESHPRLTRQRGGTACAEVCTGEQRQQIAAATAGHGQLKLALPDRAAGTRRVGGHLDRLKRVRQKSPDHS
jgi:hypothetical protein